MGRLARANERATVKAWTTLREIHSSMANFFSRLFSKQSQTQTAIATLRPGQAVGSPRTYEGFSREGFQKNVVAYRAITGISRACAGIPFLLYRRRQGGEPQELEQHELLNLLKRPNPLQGRSAFIERLVAFLMISGNSYVEMVSPKPNELPRELWVPRSDRITIIPGGMGLPAAYIYQIGDKKIRFEVDPIKGISPILHIKTFNPLDDWFGMAPMLAAALSIDNHNETGTHNLALLQNRAVPGGVVTIQQDANNPSGKLDDEQRSKLKAQIREKFSGPNKGETMILEGGMKWEEMGFSPKEMEYIEGKNSSARDIALAFGFPPQLLGIQGDNTYSNQQEARLALYEETVLPTMDLIVSELNNSLVRRFGDDLFLDYDRDKIDALAVKREAVWNRVKDADFLTPNEKRDAVGYESLNGGDTLFVDASKLPLEMALEGGDDGSSGNDDSGGGADDDPSAGSDDDEPEPAEDDENGKAGRRAPLQKTENRLLDFVKRWVARYAGTRVTSLQQTTRKRVIDAIREATDAHLEEGSTLEEYASDIVTRVDKTYESMSKTRARTIARTETTIASNEGSRAAAEALNLPNMEKEWVSADDSRTRGADADDQTNHMKMNGVRISMKEKFAVPSMDGDDMMEGPGDPSAPADQLINCRCVLLYHTGEKAMNLKTPASKRRYMVTQNRKRLAYERAFAAQMGVAFAKEGELMAKALHGVSDRRAAEMVVARILDDSKQDMERVLAANLEVIAKTFGSEVLKVVKS